VQLIAVAVEADLDAEHPQQLLLYHIQNSFFSSCECIHLNHNKIIKILDNQTEINIAFPEVAVAYCMCDN